MTRILLVDDHPIVRQGVAGLLAAESDMALVAEAANGREAIQQFRVHRPDITLMDLQMPEMGGLEATGIIRQREAGTGQHVWIVAMTAHTMQGDRDECLKAGMDTYIAKPVNPALLFNAVEQEVPASPVASGDALTEFAAEGRRP